MKIFDRAHSEKKVLKMREIAQLYTNQYFFNTRRECQSINIYNIMYFFLFFINYIWTSQNRKGFIFVTPDVRIDESCPQWSRRYHPRSPRSCLSYI